jgi:hypothetical protein
MARKTEESTDPSLPKDPEERIREAKERADDLAGGQMTAWSSGDAPPEVLAQFWENVVAYEEADGVRPFDVLTQGGLELPAVGELDDEALSQKLRDLVQAMALRGMYLLHTNHLSDRELYVHLREDSLQEEMIMPMGPEGPLGNWIIDLIGSGSEEDVHVDLKYYADEKERRDWAKRWPEDEIPEHEDPPFDRDRFLPQPGWGPAEEEFD